MEFAANGDLSTKIAQQQSLQQGFMEQFIWSVFIDMVKGLKQLHDLKILHRDIKVKINLVRLPTFSWEKRMKLNWEI